MNRLIYDRIDESLLIKRFNERDDLAFGEVYTQLYQQLNYFVNSLYRTEEIDSSDIIHDLFIKIWQDKRLTFDAVENVKAYLYTSIKNGFKNYLQHQSHVRRYKDEVYLNEDYFVTKIVETETYSVLSRAVEMLPEECAKIFKMTIEGWSADEIAEQLNKAKSTVYEHKRNAVSIIKKKIYKNKMLQLLLFLLFN